MSQEVKNLKDSEVGSEKDEGAVIPIDSIFDSFREHLKIEGNSRILFSGKFGIGKTYFLIKFFDENKNDYFAVHLHPSSYQIASNEKIIDYVKTDILLTIANPKQETNETGTPTKVKVFNKIKDTKWFRTALSIGRTIPISQLNTFAGIVSVLMKEIETVTEESIAKELGAVKEDKKAVLIVDDLDRLDPEHIFRMFNVFSALVGEDEKGTVAKKLGFDAVVFVADYKNLKSIFRHKYGNITDHEGYFNKFCSVAVFEYNPKQLISEWLQYSFCDEISNRHQPQNGLTMNNWLLRILLLTFLKNDKLNLRQLFTGVYYKTPSVRYFNPREDFDPDAEKTSKILTNTIHFLIETAGSGEELRDLIETHVNKNDIAYIRNEGATMRGIKKVSEEIVQMMHANDREDFMQRDEIYVMQDLLQGKREAFDMDNTVNETTDPARYYENLLKAFKNLLILCLDEVYKQ